MGLPLIVWAMNTQVCSATKHSPYHLVFQQRPQCNLTLLYELWNMNITDEDDLPENIEIEDSEK